MRARDQLDAMRDLLGSSLQANLAQVSVRQNDDVRRISAWVAIAPTLLATSGGEGRKVVQNPELKCGVG